MSKTKRPVQSIKQLTQELLDGARELHTLKGLAEPKTQKVREAGDRHRVCLKDALQAAVTLEFSTIPPYLCALWSIEDDKHEVAESIREVVQEEMLHMALACNMLASIGERPQINCVNAVPKYPGHLPGHVHPHLEVALSGLTPDALKGFLQIELPHTVFGLNPNEDWKRKLPKFETDVTIGEFYQAINKSFVDHPPKMSPDHQVSGPLAWAVVRSVEDASRAIDLISRQGEGSTASPYDRDSEDLAHFYRFLEVYLERKLIWSEETRLFSKGKEWKLPKVKKIGVVPPGGYNDGDLGKIKDPKVRRDVSYNLRQFDRTYTRLLDQLQGAWTLGGQASLIRAYETMFELERYAKPLMDVKIPGKGEATFGPCFRYDDEVGLRNKE